MIEISLRETHAFITGTGRGIGKAIAETFLRCGAKIHACDIDEQSLIGLAQKHGGSLTYTVADVTNEREIANAISNAIHNMGKIDAVVNNVGLAGPKGGIGGIILQELERTFAANVYSQFLCIKHALPWLRQSRNACIVNIGSAAGVMGYAARSPYSASKWAITGLTKSLATELGPENIRVNVICPGAVQGEALEGAIHERARLSGMPVESIRREYVSQSAMGRIATADDVATLAAYLCSKFGMNISGQAIGVDAGTVILK